LSIDCSFHSLDLPRVLSMFERPTPGQRTHVERLAALCGREGPRVAAAVLGRGLRYDAHPPADHRVLDRLLIEVLCDEELAEELGVEQRGYVHWTVMPELLDASDPASCRFATYLGSGRRLLTDEPTERVVYTIIAPEEIPLAQAELTASIGKPEVEKKLASAVKRELLPALERARKAGRWFLAETLEAADDVDRVEPPEPPAGTYHHAEWLHERGDVEGAYAELVAVYEGAKDVPARWREAERALLILPDAARKARRKGEDWKSPLAAIQKKIQKARREDEARASADFANAMRRFESGDGSLSSKPPTDDPQSRLERSAREYQESGYSVAWGADRKSFVAKPPAALAAFGPVSVKVGDV
jgi:hypothetical protein